MVDGGFGTGQTYGAMLLHLGLWIATGNRKPRRIFRLWKILDQVELVT